MYMANDIMLMRWAAPDIKGELTNFYNRIKITYLEDIGIGSIDLIILIQETLEKINNDQDKLLIELPRLIRSNVLLY